MLPSYNLRIMAKKTGSKKLVTKPRKASPSPKPTKPTTNPTTKPATSSGDQSLREHVISLLKGDSAHASFDDTLADWPLHFAGIRAAKFPHTAWMLLEHIRIAQLDLLEFSRNPKHVSPKFPEGYWPETAAPPDEAAWKSSMEACKKDLEAMQRLLKDKNVNVFAKIPWGDAQTILREALVMASHNSYHLGQLMMLRKSLAWA